MFILYLDKGILFLFILEEVGHSLLSSEIEYAFILEEIEKHILSGEGTR